MTKKQKVVTISLLAVLLLVAVLPLCAFAEEVTISFDDTSVLSDLNGATIMGKEFSLNDYPADANGTPQLLAFTEFSFSLLHEYQSSYGLYLYVYYPQGDLLDCVQNMVEIATTYSGDEPTAWGKYKLKLLSSDFNNVIYKFKVINSGKLTVGDIFNRVAQNPSERRYDINSIELRQNGQVNAVDYGIGGTWTFSGYSKGLHSDSMEESTLQSVANYSSTLKLHLHQTYYRGWRNTINTLADQLSSVYFSVDNKIDQGYDRLYGIDFEAYKYLSRPMFMIHDKYYLGENALGLDFDAIYNNLLNQRHWSAPYYFVKQYGVGYPYTSKYTWLRWGGTPENFDYEEFPSYGYPEDISSLAKNRMSVCSWVFQVTKEDDFKVSRDTLLSYMKAYSQEFGNDIRDKYSSDLFTSHYYSYSLDYKEVAYGENIGRTITVDDIGELRGSLSKNTFWQALSLLFSHTSQDEVTEFCPIQKVEWSDIVNLSDEEISKTYFVADEDVTEFKYYVKNENAINKSVYLFRFDIDTYYTDDLVCENKGICGYVAQEPIYLDFDIISLTYEKNGVKTVIPVVADPIDVIAGTEPGGVDLGVNDISDLLTVLLTLILGLAAVAFFVAIMWGLIKYIFNRR